MSRPSLREIFLKYGTDKEINGYRHVYEPLFKNIRDQPINLLEIGIGTMIAGAPSSMVGYACENYSPGGSLRSWRDYFPNGQIYGLDIQPDTQFTEERITTALCDSGNGEEVKAFFEAHPDLMLDIIIDDGLHWDEYQLETLRLFYDRVKPGGFYVIEDVVVGSRLITTMWPGILNIVGEHTPIMVTRHLNQIIISKPSAEEAGDQK